MQHLHDVGVLEQAQHAGLVPQALDGVHPLGAVVAQHFEGDLALEGAGADHAGAEDRPEATLAQAGEQLVAAALYHRRVNTRPALPRSAAPTAAPWAV